MQYREARGGRSTIPFVGDAEALRPGRFAARKGFAIRVTTGVSFEVYHVEIKLQDLPRDLLLLAITLISFVVTPKGSRKANDFTWFAIIEVAKLFAGIFITIPAIAILRAGTEGALAPVIATANRGGEPVDAAYFWATGILSSFLDNAPNLMVGALAEETGVRMPSFFGYTGWSWVFLMPLFALVTWVFFLSGRAATRRRAGLRGRPCAPCAPRPGPASAGGGAPAAITEAWPQLGPGTT